MKFNPILWFEKAYSFLPNFSQENKDYVAQILPGLSFIAGILLTIASVLELLGTPFISVFSLSHTPPLIQTLLLTNAIGLFQGLFMIFAFKDLKRRNERGWRIFFLSQILWIISGILSLSASALIALVVLYPVIKARSIYKVA